MQIPVQITFRDMAPSPALEASIRERAAKLEQFGEVNSCRVAVQEPHRHSHKGTHFHVRIDVTLPGDEIVVARTPATHEAHEDAYVAVREAFETMYRQLNEWVRKRRDTRRGAAAAPPEQSKLT
jgi:ribosome-associated translation inhibitor RaiA